MGSDVEPDEARRTGGAAGSAFKRKEETMKSLLLAVSLIPFGGSAQTKPTECPMHDHDHAKMNERGEKGMGFSQTATTHHFLVKPDGGVIQVEAKDPSDLKSRDEIRMHLTHIAHAFANGDFDIPMFVHDKVPPGIPQMKRLQTKITYRYENTLAGGRVVIATKDENARDAVYRFLRFQIAEHQTGDTRSVE
jgi:hypothetical protein